MPTMQIFKLFIIQLNLILHYTPGHGEPPHQVTMATKQLFSKNLAQFCRERRIEGCRNPAGWYVEVLDLPSTRNAPKDPLAEMERETHTRDLRDQPTFQKTTKPAKPKKRRRKAPDVSPYFSLEWCIVKKPQDMKKIAARMKRPGAKRRPRKAGQKQKQKGWGCFAKMNLEVGVRLAEYLGQKIKQKEGKRRFKEYGLKGLSPTMIFVENTLPKFCLDGKVDEYGDEFKPFKNVGAIFNHSFTSPNCKLVTEGTGLNMRFFIETKTRVAKGVELVWSYGDMSSGLESWYYI